MRACISSCVSCDSSRNHNPWKFHFVFFLYFSCFYGQHCRAHSWIWCYAALASIVTNVQGDRFTKQGHNFINIKGNVWNKLHYFPLLITFLYTLLGKLANYFFVLYVLKIAEWGESENSKSKDFLSVPSWHKVSTGMQARAHVPPNNFKPSRVPLPCRAGNFSISGSKW